MSGEGVDGGVGNSLPVADFLSGDSDEDDALGSSSNGNQVDVFCRYNHIKSLGLYSESDSLGLESDDLELPGVLDEVKLPWSGDTQASQPVVKGRTIECDTSNDGMLDTKPSSWNDFKAEFSDVLKVSEEKIASGEIHQLVPNSKSSRDARQDFLIEMIKAVHDSREPPTLEQEGNVETLEPEEQEDGEVVASQSPVEGVSLKPSQSSPTRPRKQLLSLSTLETIHESELDRLLETVEGGVSNGNQNDEVFNPTDSDTLSPTSPHPKPWGMKGGSSSDSANDDLMKQLHQLSLNQKKGSKLVGYDSGIGESVSESTAPESVTKQEPGNRKWHPEPATVLIDLRPQKNGRNVPARERNGSGDGPAAGQLEREDQHRTNSDDSDSEDDAFTWAQQRRHIKRGLESNATPGPPPFGSHIPSSAHHTSFSLSSHHHVPSSSSISDNPSYPAPSSSPPSNHTKFFSTNHTPSSSTSHIPLSSPTICSSAPSNHTHSSSSTTLNATHLNAIHDLQEVHKVAESTSIAIGNVEQFQQPYKHSNQTGQAGQVDLNGQSGQSQASQRNQTGQISKPNKVNKINHAQSPQDGKQSNGTPNRRQRNSDSLTLSSSYSDGDEITSSEGASCSGDSKSKPSKPTSLSTTGKKKSKKQAKKSKKSRKKEEASEKKKTERSLASQKRRAYVLQRIRQDSLNTSSDEENSLSSPGMPPDEQTPPDSLAGSSGGIMETSSTTSLGSEKDVPVDMESVRVSLRKKILSKKPPARFETPATDPIFHEDASFEHFLVDSHLSLGSKGLLVLPLAQHGLSTAVPFPELDIHSQLVLHCLVMTWLVCQAAKDCCRPQAEDKVQRDGESRLHLPINLPFSITGLQQTVLDGQPSLLIAIRMSDCKPSEEPDEPKDVDDFLTKVTLQEFLQPLLGLDSVSNCISTLCSSAWNNVLLQPLSSVFSFQADISPLSTPISFYWHSMYHLSALPSNESLKACTKINTTICSLNYTALLNADLIFSLFDRILSSGLDVAGLRLLFGDQDNKLHTISQQDPNTNNEVSLILALRGPNAVYRWVDIVGPEDSTLAKVTDPSSISAMFGSGMVHTIRTPYQLTAALAKWFGGRACLKTGTIIGTSDPYTKSERRKRQRVRFSESESEDSISISSPLPDMIFPRLICNRPRLIAQAYSKSLLVISPSVPPACYATVLGSCSELGFDIFGAKRMRLNKKRANVLQIPCEFLSQFTPSSTPASPLVLDSTAQPPLFGGVVSSLQAQPPLPSVIFIVGRENSSVHSSTLKKLIWSRLQELSKENTHVRSTLSVCHPNSVSHIVPYSEDKLKVLGDFTAPIVSCSTLKGDGVCECQDSQEELCFVAIPGIESLPTCVRILNSIFDVTSTSSDIFATENSGYPLQSQETASDEDILGKFEMVGLKIVSQLSRFHAKKLCPLSSDDSHYSQAVLLLSDKPTSIFVFRGISCNRRIAQCLKGSHTPSRVLNLEQKLQYIVSKDSLDAVNLSQLFFSGKDLYSDNSSRTLAPYLPDSWIHESDIFQSFLLPQENLFSVLQLPLKQIKLAVKVLNKLSRSGFMFAGISVMTESCTESKVSVGEASIAVCVEKVNAVWFLEHLVLPFTKERHKEELKYSGSFSSAIYDMRRLFPDGVYVSEKGAVTKDYWIKCLPEDSFSNLTLPVEYVKLLHSTSTSCLGDISPLLERTVLILPPSLLTQQRDKNSVHGFVHVLDFLCQSKFQICGMKLVLLSSDSAREVKLTLSLDIELEVLTASPSLLVVVERDNAASCFQLIAKSAFHGHGDAVSSVLSSIFAPSNLKQANHLLSFFHGNR